MTRRTFLGGTAAAAGVAAGLAAMTTGGYGAFIERYAYELNEHDIFIENLPGAFENFRIAQISDVHHGELVTLDEVRRVVELAQSARADMIALTGDYTTHETRYIEPCVEQLRSLSAEFGVWAVLGNHDHRTGPAETTRALTRAGIGVLSNAHTEIWRGGEKLLLVGVDDPTWVSLDWTPAQRGLDERTPSILLSHQPTVIDMPESRKHALILAGHTHGGQVSFPIFGAPARFMDEFRYVEGLFRREQTQLFVTRGTGVIGLPLRLGAPPEISVLRLRRAARPAASSPLTA